MCNLRQTDLGQIRTSLQLGTIVVVVLYVLLLLDNKIKVLPNAIHNRLSAHHPGLVITDVTITTCSSINIFSTCKIDGEKWHRVEKDLYLDGGFLSSAYLHIERKKEEELAHDDAFIVDVKIGRLDPATSRQAQAKEKWESRPGGIWIKRTVKRHGTDSADAVTGLDILFGSDAVDPRPNWQVEDFALLLDTHTDGREPRLTVRRGHARKVVKPTPRINLNGKFKVMQVADLHLSTGLGKCRDALPIGHNGGKCDADPRTLEFVEKMIDDEKPDFIVLSGDQVNGETAPDSQSAVYKVAEIFERRKVPYAAVFGNHDDEGDLDRRSTIELMQDLPYSLSEAGPTNIDGVGNYFVEVLGRGSTSDSALTLYLLDTHSYSPDERQFRGYDWLKPNQINWFKQTSQGLKSKHKEYTHIHMDLAFIHIPLPEYRNSNEHQIVGNRSEPPTAPAFNSGFKNALVEEGVVLVSCGQYVVHSKSCTLLIIHSDHVNDYCLLGNNDQGKPALWMCYGGAVGFGGYAGYYGYHRRIRFFDIDTNEARIHTYKRLEWGDTESKIDEQMIVDGGKVVV
jgi:Calcineurin-like phosphoesterase